MQTAVSAVPSAFKYPEPSDRFYAIVAGRVDVDIIAENEHAIAFDDGSDETTTRIAIIPRGPLSSLASLDLSDAFRMIGMLDLIRQIPKIKGWGPLDGFRIDVPVHPPYQRQQWLCLHLTRDTSKTLKKIADADGYTRDIGHYAEIVALRRRVEVVYANEEMMFFHDYEYEDNLDYDHVVLGITRRNVKTILDDDYTMQDWLSLISGLLASAARLGLPAFHAYMNINPPYQHTRWVHVHLMAGGKALDIMTKQSKQHAKHATKDDEHH